MSTGLEWDVIGARRQLRGGYLEMTAAGWLWVPRVAS